MSLESGTFINDLVITNPPGTDPILQGDDHLRLLKTVLKNTFLNADKAFGFPDAITKTAAYPVVKADINKFFQGDATTAAFSFTLPTLVAADDGWFAVFVKSDASANAVTLVGTINGAANLILSAQYKPALVWWNGTAWFAMVIPSVPALASTTDYLTGTDAAKTLTSAAAFAGWKKGSNIASAGTIAIGEGGYHHVTGTTTITDIDFSVATDGRFSCLVFDGALILTHNATTLPLPGSANITTEAGDILLVWQDAGDNVKTAFLPIAGVGGGIGSVVAVSNTQTGAVATGTTVLPYDDTIPQNTEGVEFMTLAHTPKSTTNKLKIDVVCIVASSAAQNDLTAALFQDSTANALAAASEDVWQQTTGIHTIKFTHFMAAGTVSSTTFKVRAGGGAAGTTTFNGIASARKLGGVLASSITITEIKA